MTDKLKDLRNLDLPFDLDQVSSQCHKCIRKQIEKYKKYSIDGEHLVGNKFLVPCKGIPKHAIDPSLKNSFTAEEYKELLGLNDIVEWAAQHLKLPNGDPWIARWYQAEVLRCTSRRKMLRISRRAGKTTLICVEICYHLFTTNNTRLLVAGPQKNQVEDIFNRVMELIRSNPYLEKSVVRTRAAPYYEIELSNESKLRGFAAGTKGKTGGVAIRGQDSQKIYIEEADYIDSDAINGAIIPILQTSPDTTLVGFSTPIGIKTTPFYSFCEKNPYYKEFHYDYKVIPHWKNIEMERSAFTEAQWMHEFLAEWGIAESGVYQSSYVEAALSDYSYQDCKYSMKRKYVLGVDWNEKHGAELVVLEYNPLTMLFQVVHAEVVEGTEFTQLMSVNKVIELNKTWKPSFIYADAGGGSTNIELLRKISFDERGKTNPDPDKARILNAIRSYDSGASLKIKDPVTRQERKVPAKPFMVDASVRLFEQHNIRISAHDKTLENQLKSYIIDRITPTGVPVYGTQDSLVGDHRLDALNLAIVGFALEFGELHGGGRTLSTKLAYAPDPRFASSPEVLTKGKPEERRLEGDLIEHVAFRNNYSRKIDNNDRIKTNRLGWDTDTEEEEFQKWSQRKRSRARVRRDPPKRTNI